MKKIFLLSVSSLFLALGTMGQSDYKNVRLALHFSPHIATLKAQSSALESDGSFLGFSFGAITDFHFQKNYAFSTGFSILKTGFKDKAWMDSNDGPFEAKRTIKAQYIELPAILKLKTNEIGYMSYFGQIGLSNGINIKSTQEYKPGSGETVLETAKKDVAIFRSALVMGGGFEYNLSGSTNIMFNLLYHNGFTNTINGDGFTEKDGVLTAEKRKGSSNLIEMKVGIFF